MKQSNVHIFLLLIGLCLFSACKKKEVGPQKVEEETSSGNDQNNTGTGGSGEGSSKGVFVVNEGNFQGGNASVTYYDPEDQSVELEVFQNTNSRPLGDVAQSMIRTASGYAIPVNNSGKVEIVTGTDLNSAGTVSGMNSPRYFLELAANKAYVTDLYADALHIVDLQNYQVTGSIAVNGWTEQLTETEGKVYVANMDQALLLIIDPSQDKVIDSIAVAEQPNSVIVDEENDLWVLCDGGFQTEKAALFHIDTEKDSILDEFRFQDIQDSPSELVVGPAGETLYFLNNGLFQMNTSSSQLPSQPLVKESGKVFYGLGISPDEELYVSDAVDYVKRGKVYRFDVSGAPLDTFSVGVIPGGFCFEK